MKCRQLILLLLLFGAVFQGFGQSYISRLWNTKKYSEIIEFSTKGQSLSGQDNMLIGRSYMSLETPQPTDALRHYDIAIQALAAGRLVLLSLGGKLCFRPFQCSTRRPRDMPSNAPELPKISTLQSQHCL